MIGARAKIRLVSAIALVVLGAACSGSCKRSNVSTNAAPPPADLVPDADVAKDSAVAEKPLWQAALSAPDDSVELARLADREGATGLLVGLEEGGAVGLVALAALPYADDAELASGRLGEILAQMDPKTAAPVLDSLEGIVLRKSAQVDPIDPTGQHVAFDALVAYAKNGDAPNELRARAVSIARLFADRWPFDAKLLPTAFDR